MKHRTSLLSWLASAALVAAGRAEINVPSDGSDGVFAPTANVEIDLGEAATGVWDANNAPRAGRGIYDPEQWAIVFKFASVTVPPDVTVTFKNHPSRAPVVWLVQGDVVINGLIRLDGENGDADASLTHINKEGGPGGFRGGLGTYNGSLEGAGKNGNGPSDTYYVKVTGSSSGMGLTRQGSGV